MQACLGSALEQGDASRRAVFVDVVDTYTNAAAGALSSDAAPRQASRLLLALCRLRLAAPPALAVSRAGKDEVVDVGAGGGAASPGCPAAAPLERMPTGCFGPPGLVSVLRWRGAARTHRDTQP